MGPVGPVGPVGPQGVPGTPANLDPYQDQKVCVEDNRKPKIYWGACEEIDVKGTTRVILVGKY